MTFIICSESEDSLGKIPYPTDIYYFKEFEDFCCTGTLSHWYLLFLKSLNIVFERYNIVLTFIHIENLKILQERYLVPLTFIIFKNLKLFSKGNLSHWHLLSFKKLQDSFGKIFERSQISDFREFEIFFGKIRFPTKIYYF